MSTNGVDSIKPTSTPFAAQAALAARMQTTRAIYLQFCKVSINYLQSLHQSDQQKSNQQNSAAIQYANDLALIAQSLFAVFPISLGIEAAQCNNVLQAMVQQAHAKLLGYINQLAANAIELQALQLFEQWLNALEAAWTNINCDAKWHRGLAIKYNALLKKYYGTIELAGKMASTSPTQSTPRAA